MTLVKPFLNTPLLCINHIQPMFSLYSCVLPFPLLKKTSPHDEQAQGHRINQGVISKLRISYTVLMLICLNTFRHNIS